MSIRQRLDGTTLGREILRQPTVLRNTFLAQKPEIEDLTGFLARSNCRMVDVAAIGSSKNAAMIARQIVKNRLVLNVQEPTDYVPTSQTLFLVSQSGESREIVDLLRVVKAYNSKTQDGKHLVAITNTPNSTIDKAAHLQVHTKAGKEESIAATGSMTSLITTLCAIGAMSRPVAPSLLDQLEILPGHIERFFELDDLGVDQIVSTLRDTVNLAVLGRGAMLGVAAEFALKIGETADVVTTYGDLGIFRHGYSAHYGAATEPVKGTKKAMLIIAQEGDEQLVDYYVRLSETNGFPLHVLRHSDIAIHHPCLLHDAVATVILGQVIAHETAVAKGIEPGTSRILSKVVV
jgi:fructoselysine-6-P-deglycase FrlB-like protein